MSDEETMTYNNVSEEDLKFIHQQMEHKTDPFAPVEIVGHPGWTIVKRGRMFGGLYMWQLLKDGVLIAPIGRPATASYATRLAIECIQKLKE